MTQLTFIANCPNYSTSTRTPPLAFTQDNFSAVIQGTKTETRRLLALKDRTQEEVNEITSFCQDGDGNWIGNFGNTFGNLEDLAEFTKTAYPKGSNKGIKSKYQIGDRCYLTEPTAINAFIGNSGVDVQYFWHKPEIIEKTITIQDEYKIQSRKSGINSKQIARFMLKNFARYWVEITEVKLERLMDITHEGAIAEGIKSIKRPELACPVYFDYVRGEYIHADPCESYLSEIAAIHKPTKDKIGGWDLVNSNPWVWVYKFKRVTNNE